MRRRESSCRGRSLRRAYSADRPDQHEGEQEYEPPKDHVTEADDDGDQIKASFYWRGDRGHCSPPLANMPVDQVSRLLTSIGVGQLVGFVLTGEGGDDVRYDQLGGIIIAVLGAEAAAARTALFYRR